MTFKQSFDFTSRRDESRRICAKYPGRVPVVVERSRSSVSLPQIDKPKFLAPNELTVGQFLFVVKKRLQCSSEQAMYLLANDTTLMNASSSMCTVFEQYRDEDGFLYVAYAIENTFGSDPSQSERGLIRTHVAC